MTAGGQQMRRAFITNVEIYFNPVVARLKVENGELPILEGMPYKLIKKEKIAEYLEKYRGSIYIEAWHSSKPRFFLELKTPSGSATIARVPKNIFKWFVLIPSTTPTGYINTSWFLFGDKQTPKHLRVTDFNNPSLLAEINKTEANL